MPRISVVGEHNLTIKSISRLLKEEPRFKLALPAQNKSEQYTADNLQPDVIVYCANSYSNSLYKQINNLHLELPNIKKVLIISMAHRHFIKKLINAGVDAIVSYKSSADDLIQAVKCASLRQQYLSPDLSQIIMKSKYPSSFNSLSQRELEITYLLANGMNVKNVSSELDISPKTVNTYRYRIFNKLNIGRNIDLFRLVNEKAAYMLSK